MDHDRAHRLSRGDGTSVASGPTTLYRLNSNQSSSSVFEDVEMAHDELYSGPVAESLPSSVSAFSHRRARAGSTASFTYYEEPEIREREEQPGAFTDLSESFVRRSLSDLGDLEFGIEDEEDSADREYLATHDDYMLRRRSSAKSRDSVHAHLLRRDSTATVASARAEGRNSQKVYMANEDLTIVVAGFRTSTAGFLIYTALCFLTGGLAFLLLRWLPRWYISIVGRPCSLRNCDWVVIENQWGELSIIQVTTQEYGRPVSSVFGIPEKPFLNSLDDDNDPLIDHLRSLDYRYVRLYFHPIKDQFVMSAGWKDPEWTDARLVRSGLDSDDKTIREAIFGNNLIDIEQKTISQLLVEEVLHPFYIFQIGSLILWSLDSYYYYAACIFIMSVASISATLIETRATMLRLREISRFECDVRVLRNGFWKYVSSSDLVPGDIYELSDPNLSQFPSDSLLLTGDCIVNESMLTGESVPVSKIPATDETLCFMDLAAASVSPEIARHFLYCGTKIIRTRRPQEGQDEDAVALALVVRTGFNTTKGALVRSMLFPKPSGFKFYRDSFRYISVMAIVAMLGFIMSFVNFLRLELAWHFIIVRALDLITIVVPPALPATLTIGTNFALSRLKKKQIFCISPQRVNVGGKIDVMCFDKTGTLTEDGLDVLGLRISLGEGKQFSELLSRAPVLGNRGTAPKNKNTVQAALYTMATCHSLRSVDGDLVGDPLDQKMFEFTGWSFEEGKHRAVEGDDDEQSGLTPSIARPPDNSTELGVLKSFEFISQLRRASVITRHFGQKSGDIFVKGAPEAMREICRPETFPDGYDDLLSYYTHKGYRVIGCATRHLPKLSWVKAQKMTRLEVESNLDFVGFIIFENKLKPTTEGVLKELLDSNIGTIMVTGDNILTAISVARESGLLDRQAHCFVPRFVRGDARDPMAELQWESIDNSRLCLDKLNLLPLPAPPEEDVSLPYDISNLQNFSLAVSGEAFRWIVDYSSPDVLQRMLVRGKIFARMSPDEKHELVEKLQSIDFCCGFCGDGANDCGALKAADVGISLSEAEASVAAPFTSRVFDIRCVPEVIREGRAALVTSFSCFKYMSLYSAIQFTSVSFLYAKASNLGDFQFLFIDLLLILPIAILMGWAGPAPLLCRKRPTADLVSRKVLTPLLGLMAICVLIQGAAFLAVREQAWYKPPKVGHDEPNIKNSENTALFLSSCFEYILSGVVLNAGPPFRQDSAKNWPFTLTIAAALIITVYMVVGPAQWIKKLMELSHMEWDYKLFLMVLGLAYFALAWTFEKYLAMRLARVIGYAKQRITGRAKMRKKYKVIREEMWKI
ncbi:hypothetical protein J3458_012852 [Metarhizium acridum]|uniref:uncharacterized protein n=1 Tax=Metarhizium acridum TaxID=92637 RepID=UPI001C6BA5B6|nr:hypothetical protein J3458_012852 [Metarhizium acridum]